jgi:hypothetical protein
LAEIKSGRWTAQIEGDFVVFLIGARIDFLHPIRSIRDLGELGGLSPGQGMGKMLAYLVQHPEKGLLAYEMGLPTIVQYWRSFDHLEAFAKNEDDPHLHAWRNFWRRVAKSGRSGIWHETYLVRAGEYENIYGNMPLHGLGKAGRLVPATGDSTARNRIRAGTRTTN